MMEPRQRSAERERQVLDAMLDMEAHSDCGYAGHEWESAGGGLLICVNCTAEKWEDARSLCGRGCHRVCEYADCVLYGAGGICGRHGIYEGVACPRCEKDRDVAP